MEFFIDAFGIFHKLAQRFPKLTAMILDPDMDQFM
jgi:hypothetical protein